MKKLVLLAQVLLFSLSSQINFAQVSVQEYTFTPDEYQTLKENGQIPEGNIKIVLPEAKTANRSHGSLNTSGNGASNRSGNCGCYVQPDASYTVAMAPNDDGSTAAIALPFTFCLYGDNYTSLFINNNGNVSFGTSYGTFSSSGFPSANYVMVAPFWADVDTRPAGGGTVYYKITPTAIYVNWEAVGYYSMAIDKLNTFQLILTNGNDPVIGIGNNVAFCYGDMQWTTGAASGGVGGFGGTAATVGSNRGNGVDFVQFGRFDQAGAAYDGPFGANDGVSWLDYATFKFNTCVTGSNLAPILSSVSPSTSNGSGSGIACGDTLRICGAGDTLMLSASFIAPEAGQTISFTVNAPTLSNLQVLSTTGGTINMMLVSSLADAGFNQIDITATDNGTPAMSTTFPLTIYVDTAGLSAFSPTIIGPDTVCANSVPVTLTTQVYDSYEWSTGSLTQSTTVSTSDTTWLTVGLNNCFKSTSHVLTVLPQPTPAIVGGNSYCAADGGVQVASDSSYASYSWTQGATVVGTDSTEFLSAGSYVLTVTDDFGCTGTANITISVINPTISVSTPGPNPFCQGNSINLIANGTPGLTYSWNTGQSVSTISVNSSGTYVVTGTLGSCTVTDSIVVTATPLPTVNITGPSSICTGTSAILVANATGTNPTFSWTGGSTNDSLTITAGATYIVTVTDGGCSTSDTLVVTSVQTPSGSIVGNTSFCPGDSTVLTANYSPGTTTYLWNTGATTPSILVTSGGTYSVVATNGACSSTGTVTVNTYGQPTANFTTNPASPFLFNTLATLNDASTIPAPDSIVSWTWTVNGSPASTNEDWSYLFTNPGDYSVTLVVMSNNGCLDTITQIVQVVADLTIPNVFSPGTTPGANDLFEIKNLGYYPNSKLTILNRWGQVVYSSDNYANDWNGTKMNDGKMVSSGTYFYILVLEDGTDYKGTVTVFGEK